MSETARTIIAIGGIDTRVATRTIRSVMSPLDRITLKLTPAEPPA
jgi:carbamoylphosphate synthase small subunit